MSPQLSTTARAILGQLAAGHSVEQILLSNLKFRYADIADAARKAIQLDVRAEPNNVRRIRRTYPNAYDPWTADEIARLLELNRSGKTIDEIAAYLGRQPSAIRSRLERTLTSNPPQ
jgi:DNA-binding NarL/FixJ family response regulator